MAILLLLETATEVCSAALSRDGKLLAFRETTAGFSHAEKLTVFLSELLEDPALVNRKPDAVCVSSGPGSYTGLRIGVSAAKGICFALDIPLLAVSTLDALAYQATHPENPVFFPDEKNVLICPMLDARRMEVYTALYDSSGVPLSDITAQVITGESFAEQLELNKVVFLGNGADKCRDIIRHPNATFKNDFHASARFMPSLAEEKFLKGEFEDLAYFEPFYLKDFMATIPKNKLF
jgi:tRNA threonylcarbamoyladenosine biosynthesis protein TsaB